MDTQRITFLEVPIDIVPPEALPDVVARLLMPPKGPARGLPLKGKGKNIVLLSLADLLRARRDGEYRSFVRGAALVIPISKSIVSGVRFLTGKKPSRYMPFNFVVSLLSLLERKEHSIYLLGGRRQTLRKTEKNIHATFPRLKIVGRHEGYMRKNEEAVVIEAIRKASPSLLLAAKGIRKEELWIARNSVRLNSELRLWCSDLFDVFAEKKRRPSDAVFDKGLEGLLFCFRNPLRFFRIFPYLWYNVLLLTYKIFRR
ncbi:MAG: WecB/TagA/CpsF family glycosyltransferase [Treponema sp.]|nr:WecB/TagA/CpsF family glycosyltransferase [Treponema sp.]